MTDQEYLEMQEKILNFIKDGDNRKKILQDPKKVFNEEFKITVPSDVEISIIENGPATYNFFIPASEKNVGGNW